MDDIGILYLFMLQSCLVTVTVIIRHPVSCQNNRLCFENNEDLPAISICLNVSLMSAIISELLTDSQTITVIHLPLSLSVAGIDDRSHLFCCFCCKFNHVNCSNCYFILFSRTVTFL